MKRENERKESDYGPQKYRRPNPLCDDDVLRAVVLFSRHLACDSKNDTSSSFSKKKDLQLDENSVVRAPLDRRSTYVKPILATLNPDWLR